MLPSPRNRTPHHQLPHPPRLGPRRRRRKLQSRKRRSNGPSRRIRLRQNNHRTITPQTPPQRGQNPKRPNTLQRARPGQDEQQPDPENPLERNRNSLPRRDERSQPSLQSQRPDHRSHQTTRPTHFKISSPRQSRRT